MEYWVSRIAVASFIYYCATFLFELGYFWEIGGGYMAAFSVTEHAVHAASVMLSVLVFVVLFFGFWHVPELLYPSSRAVLSTEPPPSDEPIGWGPRLGFAGFLVAGIFLAVEAYPAPMSPKLGMYTFVFAGFVAFYAMKAFRLPSSIWKVFSVLAILFLPAGMGQLTYEYRLRDDDAIFRSISVNGKRFKARVIFLGNSRMLAISGKTPVFIDYANDITVMR